MAVFSTQRHYGGLVEQVSWNGYSISDRDAFLAFLRDTVRKRLHDSEEMEAFREMIQGLETAGVDPGGIEAVLDTPSTPPKPWEVGEAVAECLLSEDAEWLTFWPWNNRRDKKADQASLPGADLVGFKTANGEVRLLFGEVKTSNDAAIPPRVVRGRRDGLIYQVETLADSHSPDRRALIEWLWIRCKDTAHFSTFKEALCRYASSHGKDLLLVGVLLRDTTPNEQDLRGKAEGLGNRIGAPTRVHFLAWYLPHPIDHWPTEAAEIKP